ncbi:EmrB/QacA subfamily drug resistance transporter [Azospirillum fermentarium]|uniref:MFS transporter n=1 Tax=Azospirillum fermentarium TaxID=1233114 RepID=UPI0022268873|nr:MFS transporter [Azospirillum fermentarium]MCW2245045.1 EmrB/QacA subfamily drug resistance transporter [Azospirillum fermentarium]
MTKTMPMTARWALGGLSLAMLMPSLDTSIANTALPALSAAFAAPFPQVQWVVLSYLLAVTCLIAGAGRLGDVAGRRRVLLAGTALFTAASLVCSLASTLWVLIAARAAQGAGAAAMMALTTALVGSAVPADRAGRAIGLLGTMSAAGTALGPSLGGLLTAAFGWRAIFLVTVPLGLLVLGVAWRTLPADPPRERDGQAALDPVGILLLALPVGAYALAMTGGAGPAPALLAVAAVGAVLFVRAQAHSPAPLLHVALFRGRALGAGLAATLLVSAVVMATLVIGPFYLSQGLGLDAAHAGLVLSAGPLAAAVASVPAGRVVDRWGSGRVTVAGLGGMVVGLSALSTVAAGFGVAGYMAAIVTVTIGYAFFQVANNTAIVTGAPDGRRGAVSGVLSLSRNLGLVTGASVMGSLFAAASAALGDVAGGMRVTFAAAAVLILVALAVIGHAQAAARRMA